MTLYGSPQSFPDQIRGVGEWQACREWIGDRQDFASSAVIVPVEDEKNYKEGFQFEIDRKSKARKRYSRIIVTQCCLAEHRQLKGASVLQFPCGTLAGVVGDFNASFVKDRYDLIMFQVRK